MLSITQLSTLNYQPGALLAAWLNDLNPVALHLSDWLQIRWYGLAYVIGFLCGFLFLRAMARKGLGVLPETQLADFVTYTALFGVMLGGRLGSMLLYDQKEFFANPLTFFHLTKGGMASHGGILGIVVFTWVYARMKKVSWTALGDMLVVPAPIGIFFGRIANFINGELWGHEARGLPWTVKFPEEALNARVQPALHDQVMEYLHRAAPEHFQETRENPFMVVIERLRSGDQALRELLETGLPERHPSQIYEALLEGALLFVILCYVRLRWKTLPHGVLTGLFFILYAVLRIVAEHWRVPDSRGIEWMAGFLTPGQQYSVPMLVIGAAFLWHAWRCRASPK
ncbi:MAG: prolipoprotein diacylglyceryl transferase [Verrucomicrobiales bacterium]